MAAVTVAVTVPRTVSVKVNRRGTGNINSVATAAIQLKTILQLNTAMQYLQYWGYS